MIDETDAGDDDEQVHSVEFDWEDDQDASGVVLSAIGTLSGRDVTDLPPLHTVVDVDALNNLFRSRPDDAPRTSGSLTFPYAGFSVTVYADGLVVVRDTES